MQNNEERGEVLVGEVVQNVMRVSGKRSRNDIAMAVIEISQDELMRNQPREGLSGRNAFWHEYQVMPVYPSKHQGVNLSHICFHVYITDLVRI